MNLNEPITISGMICKQDRVRLITEQGGIIMIKFQLSNMHSLPTIVDLVGNALRLGNSIDINIGEYMCTTNAPTLENKEEYAELGLTIVEDTSNRYVQSESDNHAINSDITFAEPTITLSDGETSVEVKGQDGLISHIDRANKEGSKSMLNLIKRVTAVLGKREHSIESLLEFLTSNDLPITEDGDILAYKALNWSQEYNCFKDFHTGKIYQALGTVVCIDESLVDTNRHSPHSTGLHVGNKNYRNSTYGSFTTIAKVRPEDFITVPKSQNDKGRVCQYTIVGVLTKDAIQLPESYDKEFVFPLAEESKLLDKLLSGATPKLVNKIKVAGSTILEDTPITEQETPKETSKVKRSGKPIKHKEKPSTDALKGKPKGSLIDNKVLAREMYENGSSQKLYTLKQKAKKTFAYFGFNDAEVADINDKIKALRKG